MNCILVQINPIVGALEHNAKLILDNAKIASKNGADIICFPELSLSGYPPEDLILKDDFCINCQKQIALLQKMLPLDILVIFGTPLIQNNKKRNAAIIILNGEIIGKYYKILLPNYGVFDEKRLFIPGSSQCIINYKNKNIGIHICEDSWDPNGKAVNVIDKKIDFLINLSASPYHQKKQDERINILRETAIKLNTTLLYCNMVGGQDELVFDGASLVISPNGKLLKKGKSFEIDQLSWKTFKNLKYNHINISKEEEIYQALSLGLKDYVEKTGFEKVLIALSGGIDSALVLAIAVDVLGAEKVVAVTMPSQFSSHDTLNDAIKMADKLNVLLHKIPIEDLYNKFLSSLSNIWGLNKKEGLSEENLQARIRGNLAMAISNEYNWLLLTTGNKSEIAMGYCTLYGDMCGGFALLKDVPKTMVFKLCMWRNSINIIIPPTIILRPPSAELRLNQKDTDTLPPYEELDPILEGYIEENKNSEELISEGHNPDLVKMIIENVEKNEYKRRQTPPGVKITPHSFDRDRRMPIVNKYFH